MGRVLIVNTLIESKLVYRLSVLANIEQQIVQQLHDIIMEYVWEGKKAKISFDILSAPKTQGGLRLCDIKAKHRTLLCQWIFALKDDGILRRAMYEELLPHISNQDLWKCNLHPKDVIKLIPKNTFWRSVLEAWAHFNYKNATTYHQVIAETLWFNSDIRINGLPFINVKLYQAGMKTVEDLTNVNGQIMNTTELNIKYGDAVNWLQLEGVRQAIPKRWYTIISERTKFEEKHENNYE